MIDRADLEACFATLKSTSPLVHNITNYVAMNYAANALLAIGASPVMAHAKEEVEDMVAISGALTINIGTFDGFWEEGMLAAGWAASGKGIPWILDPVGAGATPYRTELSWKLIRECKPSIIRGNASEIMALTDAGIKSKGVDSSASSDSAVESAKKLARETGAVVAISGATDYVTDGERVETITNGDPMMTKVTATGCSQTTIMGAFAAITDPFRAALYSFALCGIAGEKAAAISRGNGSMAVNYIDELYSITPSELAELTRQ